MRAIFWVQHLLGIGHVRRAQALVAAMAARGIQVTVIQGGFDVPGQNFAGAEIVKLPPVRAANAAFSELIDERGRAVDRTLQENRKSRLLAALTDLRPDIVVTETFPFGRRAFRHELIPLLEAASALNPKPVIVASVRDVLVAKKQKSKEAWMADTAQRFYDAVIVHGDPALISFNSTFPFTEQLANILFYSGYIAVEGSSVSLPKSPRKRDIVVSAGGGAVAGPLFHSVLQAADLSHIGNARWRFLVGPDMPVEERRRALDLAAECKANVALEPAVPDLAATLADACLSISQAGYNTVMDILRSNVRALVVPFAAGGESEQSIRAEALAERGRLHCLSLAEAQRPALLSRAIRLTMEQPEPAPISLKIDGAAVSADHIVKMAGQDQSNRTRPR